ncbi:MAG: T9SS C-terminal target domain-containing protein [Bacteroidetes bacterium]|nr:MAG: T9SS C-terminal target domain-containing protein [Bacteroidota bacterium]
MQRLLLSNVFILLLAISLNAQSWTAYDYLGNYHDITDHNNKAVLVDLSAHWCPPCWSWHQTGVMEELYHDFGPDGTNEFMVFFIDGDQGSSNSQLMGGGDSQGDWTAGTEYPIIGPNGWGAHVASHYNFGGYPTLFLHCGSGTAAEIGRTSKWAFWQNVRNMCPGAFDDKVHDATLLLVHGAQYICPSGGNADFALEVYNAGTATLNSFDIELRNPSGTVVHTQSFSSQYLSHAERTTVTVSYPVAEVGTWTAKVVSPNGFTDTRPSGDEEDLIVAAAPEATDAQLTVEIDPDDYPAETSWEIIDPNGVVILNSPPYSNGQSSIPDANVTATENGCYQFNIYDSYGDGICCSYGYGHFKVWSGGNLVISGGEFGSESLHKFWLNDPSLPLLPVDLIYFDVIQDNCEITLEWATAREVNNEKFVIERSDDGTVYKEIGQVAGQGDSQEKTVYRFIDQKPFGKNYYRLRQVDFDGKESFSNVISAELNCNEQLTLQLTPNMVKNQSDIRILGGTDEDLQIQVISVQGKLIRTFEVEHRDGFSQQSLDVSGMANGVYYLRAQAPGNNMVLQQSFVVSR